jgi:hypothetical protein
MKKSQEAGIPEAILKNWWWRRLVFVDYDEVTHITRHKRFVPEFPSYGFTGEWSIWQKDELTAFRFELLRRVSFIELPCWYCLPTWLASWVNGALKPKAERSVCAMFGPTAPPGYTSLDWMWDLTASDESLCRAFIREINVERTKIRLPRTNDPFDRIKGNIQRHSEKRRGKRNRQVSWLAVEVFDIQHHNLRPLTDGERSRLSKARREIKVFEESLRSAIASAEKYTPAERRKTVGESVYARFIRENFVERFASRLQRR